MKARLINLWDNMTGSYWFIPATFITMALIGAMAFPLLDKHFTETINVVIPQHSVSAASAQTILTAIIGAMTTVISLVFSLTILTLSIATSQFGPRLLRSFLNNRSTQIVLGTFVATAIYAFILLAVIRDTDAHIFVPRLSLLVALVAAVGNLIFLIHFVNDIADLIQVPNVVERVAHDLDNSVDRLYPPSSKENDATEPDTRCDLDPEENQPLNAHQEGYVQGVDTGALVAIATETGIALHLSVRPGDFIALGTPLGNILGQPEDTDTLERRANQCVVSGPRRTPRQDVECALLELVELAVRALSPGINDPFTAVNCVDRLGAALGRIANRDEPPTRFTDDEGALRLVMPAPRLENLIDAAFNQIRQHGQGNTAVLIRILEALGAVARQIQRSEDARAIQRHVAMIEREGENSIHEPNDLNDLKDRADAIVSCLDRWIKTDDSQGGEQT